jgi:hypothetical protein
MKTQDNFTIINKEANKFWEKSILELGNNKSKEIKTEEKSMSLSQKEAAEVQKNAAIKLFNEEEIAVKNMKKGGIRNPSLMNLGNDIIWRIYKANGSIANAKSREDKQKANDLLTQLNDILEELYEVIEIGKDTDDTFGQEYFGLGKNRPAGQVEGMALVGGDTPVWSKTMTIRMGLAGDNAYEEYYIGDYNEIRLRYNGGALNGETIDKPALQWLAYDPGIVLDIKSQNIKMLQAPSTLDENGEQASILDESLQYNDPYLLLDKAYMEISDDGTKQTEFFPANMPKIISDTKARSIAKTNSILDVYEEANIVWRNNFNQEKDLEYSVAPNGMNVSEEQQVQFQELMFESLKELLPTVAMGATTEVIKEEVQPEMVEEEVLTADQFN